MSISIQAATKTMLQVACIKHFTYLQPLNHTWFNSLERNYTTKYICKNCWTFARNIANECSRWHGICFGCMIYRHIVWLHRMHFELTFHMMILLLWQHSEKFSEYFMPESSYSFARRKVPAHRKIVSNDIRERESGTVHIFHLGGFETCNNETMTFSKAERRKKKNQRKWT